ncbi:hypothetical protein ACOMHN_040209 [Nucella lapillus]
MCAPRSVPQGLCPKVCAPRSVPQVCPKICAPRSVPQDLCPKICAPRSVPQCLCPKICAPRSVPQDVCPKICAPTNQIPRSSLSGPIQNPTRPNSQPLSTPNLVSFYRSISEQLLTPSSLILHPARPDS